MSRSRKKTNIVKDRASASYHKQVRNFTKHHLRAHTNHLKNQSVGVAGIVGIEGSELDELLDYASPSAKVAVNDYDYRDWSFRVESDDEFARKAMRK